MIRRIIFGKSLQPKLGRWTTQQSKKEMNRKIDLANTDHCGTCETPKQYIPVGDDVIEIETLAHYSGFYHKK